MCSNTIMEIQSSQITKFLKTIMVISGSWRFKLSNNKLIQTMYNLYSVIFQVSILCLVFSLIVDLLPLFRKREFQLIVENLGYSISMLVMLIKIIISQTSKIRNLIRQCMLEEIRTYNEEPEIIQNIVTRQIKILNHINLVPILISISILATYCSSKYIDYLEYKDLNIPGGRPLPMPIWYPFDTDKYYRIAFLIAVYFNFIGSTCNAVTQVFFYTLTTYVALQIKVLKVRAKDFHLYSTTLEENEEKMILVLLRDICIKHKSIISFVEELNEALNYVLLLEFIFNSLNIASIMIQIIIMPHNSLIGFIIVFLVTRISQLFLMSWHANEIEVESVSLADALFQSDWYNQSEKAKRIISIIMLRSTKPLSLFIGPFYPMTNSTALSTLKIAYSYVTLIGTMATEE